MAAYAPLPTNTLQETDQNSKNGTKSIVALLALSICAGSAAVYSMNSQPLDVSNSQTQLTSYASSCLQQGAKPVMDGYDLVAYFSLDAGSAGVQGSSDYQTTIYDTSNNGYTFYFSSESNKELFEASPTSYLPKYGGFCAWGIAEEDWWTKDTLGPDGNPNVWSMINGELYFFMFDTPQAKFLGTSTDDDLDASGDTMQYKSDGDTRWDDWFGLDYAFNTGCFNYDTTQSDVDHDRTADV